MFESDKTPMYHGAALRRHEEAIKELFGKMDRIFEHLGVTDIVIPEQKKLVKNVTKGETYERPTYPQ